MNAPVITLDGPSGVGKGTIARALARKLGWHRLDSGALYRLLALAARRRGLALEATAAIVALVPALEIRFVEQDDTDEIWLDGERVGPELRSEATGNAASVLAANPEVRSALVARQQGFRQPPGLIADGRDMGTVIFPDAVLKVFLEATPEARARRRLGQLSEMGATAILTDLCAEIAQRDRRDRERAVAPLRPAEDAVVIDTTRRTPDEVLAEIDVLLSARGLR